MLCILCIPIYCIIASTVQMLPVQARHHLILHASCQGWHHAAGKEGNTPLPQGTCRHPGRQRTRLQESKTSGADIEERKVDAWVHAMKTKAEGKKRLAEDLDWDALDWLLRPTHEASCFSTEKKTWGLLWEVHRRILVNGVDEVTAEGSRCAWLVNGVDEVTAEGSRCSWS
jgi:hypothetical protein